MRTSVFTALAALAASTIATPVETRQQPMWPATNVTVLSGHIPYGVNFRVQSPAGYFPGAPAFDVYCEAINPSTNPTACTANSPLAAGSKVETSFAYSGDTVTVYHTFGFGSTKAMGGSGDIYGLIENNVNFELIVDQIVGHTK